MAGTSKMCATSHSLACYKACGPDANELPGKGPGKARLTNASQRAMTLGCSHTPAPAGFVLKETTIMQPFRLAIPLGLFLALGSFAAQGAPGYEPYPRPHHHAPPPKPALVPGWKQQAAPAPQHKPRPGQQVVIQPGPPPRHQPHPGARPHQPPPKPVRPVHQAHRPPADFRPVHVHIHANRHHIGRGPALPPHVHIVRGKPLPPGWGKRLSAHQLHYVPHYHGYEWRRTGSDLVLVALATGIVHEILHEVLR